MSKNKDSDVVSENNVNKDNSITKKTKLIHKPATIISNADEKVFKPKIKIKLKSLAKSKNNGDDKEQIYSNISNVSPESSNVVESLYGQKILPDNIEVNADLRTNTQKKVRETQKKPEEEKVKNKTQGTRTYKQDTSKVSSSGHKDVKSSANRTDTNMRFFSSDSQQKGSPTSNSSKKSYKTTRKRVFISKKKQDKEKQIQFVSKKVVKQLNPVPKKIKIMETITIAGLAKKMNLKSSDILTKLMSLGTMSTINAAIDYETAQLLAAEYECEVELISLYEQTIIEEAEIKNDVIISRPPVITIMGHVDHGKTTLLDLLRGSNVVDNEHGSITQHIGAYQVKVNDSLITVLDTPGHFAFSKIRSRGVSITDIIVLVIAVNDGIKPQTEESIRLALDAKIPIVVALNKMDLPDVNEEKVLQELSEHNLLPEEWGGDVPVCRISALNNTGIDGLLEHILLQSEILDLQASNKANAKGTVLESKIEKGRGIVLTVLIQNGTLRVGDPFIAGIYNGKVRAIYDDMGNSIKECFPGSPIELIGVEDAPSAGDPFQVTESEKIAKQVSTNRQELDRYTTSENITKVTTDNLYSTIESDKVEYYNVVIKGDVYSSVEAIQNALLQLGNDEVKVKVIQSSTGQINENDIMLASTSNADVIAFNIKPNNKISQLAIQEKVAIDRHSIIFTIIEKATEKLNSLLRPEVKEEEIAEIEVLEIFKISKTGTIAGSKVLKGIVEKNAIAKIFRDSTEIFSGTISSLKRIKDDVNSVEKGFECGIGIDSFNDFKIGDTIKAFKEITIARTLS